MMHQKPRRLSRFNNYVGVMTKRVDVAIIGAGSAGLAARREVAKKTKNYVVIDDGILGTTCARVGCMPSKALIESANLFHRRQLLGERGISGADQLRVNLRDVMRHMRSLRDHFVSGVMKDVSMWQDHLVRERAQFLDQNTLQIGKDILHAKKIIIATGSTPIVPREWQRFRKYLINTNDFFELDDLPNKLGVIGLGAIGLELGQALARLGVEIQGVGCGKSLGGLSDPELQDLAFAYFGNEFPIVTGGGDDLREQNGQLVIISDGAELLVDRALVTLGRRPNVAGLGLENTGAKLDAEGMPEKLSPTFQIDRLPIFLVGDANGDRPILHEAADQGYAAGTQAVSRSKISFKSRVPLGIVFCDPNIAVVGASFKSLREAKKKFVTGKVSFATQGRATIKGANHGALHVYMDPKTKRLLGCEMFAPAGEHLAHELALAMTAGMPVPKLLTMPFYHPTLEEGLRTALRQLM